MTLWEQLKEKKLALFSFYFLVFVALVAVFAPFLANNKPFVIYSKSSVIFNTYKDNALGTLDLLQKNLKNNTLPPKTALPWLKVCIKEVKAFIDFKKAPFLTKDNFDFSKKNYSIQDLETLKKHLLVLNPSHIKPRFFFPLFKSLKAQDVFFMFLAPLLLFFPLFLRKISWLQKKGSWFLLLLILLFSLFASFFFSLKPSRFDPFSYQQIAQDMQKGEWALFPIIPFGENQNRIAEASQPPTFFLKEKKPSQAFHLLGTDTNGRDVLARMIYGAQISMSIGFVAVGIYVLIGIFLGALAGYYGGWTDQIISRFLEIMICFPVFFLILTVMAFLKPSIFNIMVIIGLTGWPGIARLMRGEFLNLINREFVLAARSLGASDFRIIFYHILPNGITPIIISATFGIAGAILTESALSFLGFGVPQPTASWGDLLNNGRNDIYGSWWLTVFPGLAIFLTVTAFNLMGETLRDIFDPRLRGVK